MKKKILSTGLTGLVGSRVAELLGKDFDFVDLSLPRYDILDSQGLELAFKREPEAKIFLHLAAFTDVNKAWEERGNKKGLCYRVNVLGTRNIARLCLKFQKYLVLISTDFVFNGQKKGFYTEDDLIEPIEWYGQTKCWAEEEVERNLKDFAIVRIAFPYRAKFEPKIDLVRKIIAGLKEDSLYPMFTDQITTPTFIDDIAIGLGKIFETKPKGIYHLVGSSSQSAYELACQVAEVFGFDKKLVKKSLLRDYKKNQPSESRSCHQYLSLSNQKAKEKLGILMSSLKEGLEKIKAQMIEFA